jgi:hypothetical protein
VRLTKVAVVFVALAVAFGRAGYGNLLTSLATIARPPRSRSASRSRT